MRSAFLPVLTGVCAAIHASCALAQAADEPLRLRGAIQRALSQQPELQGFEFSLRAQEARVTAAGLRPTTQVEALLEDAGGTGERDGFNSAQTTLSLSHVIELGGKRDARIAAAEAVRTELGTSRAARQLDVTAEVARRFIENLRDQQMVAIAQENVSVVERTQEAVAQRVRAGRAPAAEAARAEVRTTRAKIDLEHAEHELSASRQYLAAAMGDREIRFGPAEGNLSELTAVLPLDAMLTRIESSPDFMRFADEARVRDAELRLAEVQRLPDVRTHVGVRRYESGDDVALVAGFSVPLFTARRARSDIDIARAARARTDTEREALLLKVRAQLHAQYRELEHARLEAQLLRNELLPRLEDALEKTEYAYRRGRYSYLEWTDAQRELLEARARLIEVSANFHTLRVEVERLTGQSLEQPGNATGVNP